MFLPKSLADSVGDPNPPTNSKYQKMWKTTWLLIKNSKIVLKKDLLLIITTELSHNIDVNIF